MEGSGAKRWMDLAEEIARGPRREAHEPRTGSWLHIAPGRFRCKKEGGGLFREGRRVWIELRRIYTRDETILNLSSYSVFLVYVLFFKKLIQQFLNN